MKTLSQWQRLLLTIVGAAVLHVGVIMLAPKVHELGREPLVPLRLVAPLPPPVSAPARRRSSPSRPARAPLPSPVFAIKKEEDSVAGAGSALSAPALGDGDGTSGVTGSTGSRGVEVQPAVLAAYRQLIGGRIAAVQHYPLQARRQRIEGVTTVVFRVQRDGALAASPRVRDSSHPVLDHEALRMIEAAAPFPALPAGAAEVIEFALAIRFALAG